MTRQPPGILIPHGTKEEREDWIKSWHNLTWFTDPWRKLLESRRDEITNLVMFGAPIEEGLTQEDLRAEYRVIERIIKTLP